MKNVEEAKFEVREVGNSIIEITAQSDAGTMCNSIYLWPKEIFNENVNSSSIDVNISQKPHGR